MVRQRVRAMVVTIVTDSEGYPRGQATVKFSPKERRVYGEAELRVIAEDRARRKLGFEGNEEVRVFVSRLLY